MLPNKILTTVSNEEAVTHRQDIDTDSDKTAKDVSATDDSATTIYR